jgi:hypothetical protein
MSERPFGLTDDEYWTDPKKNLAQVAENQVLGDVEGILLDAPRQVILGDRATLPLLTFYSGKTQDLYDVRFAAHAVVTAIDLEQGVVHAALAVEDTGLPAKPVSGPKPSPGFTGEFNEVEARGRLGLPWRPGRYLITMILRDKVSDRVQVELVNSPSSYEDPEVKKYLEEQRGARPPRGVSPTPDGSKLTYRRLDDSPGLPEGNGLVIEADRVVPGKPGQAGYVRGSFRLPVRKTDVYRRTAGEDEEGNPLVTAVASVTLLIVGSDRADPWTYPMLVPSTVDVEGDEENPVATGHFRVDLMQLKRVASEPQTHFVYGFAGAHMVGPAPLAVVDPADLSQD